MVGSPKRERLESSGQGKDDAMHLIQESLAPLGYAFEQKLGEGSYANVYLVKWRTQERMVPMACKILKVEKLARDEKSLNYITRELFVHLNVCHPFIIHTFSVFQMNQNFMILMRNAEYNNVTNFLMRHGSVKERVARFWIRQTASALYYLHELDLIHRDMKCDNLLISINHNLKLSDFGFARFTIDLSGKPTKCSTSCGSIPYCAPEVFKGQPYEGKPTDVWGLGAILFVMLNKKLPFKHSNNYTKMYQEQMKCNYVWTEEIKANLSDECVETISKLLNPDPKRRITCEDFLGCRWIKMDSTLVKTTKPEAEALEKGYERRNEIKPYKFPKFTLDTKGELKVWSQDNKPWASTKDLLKVQVNREVPVESVMSKVLKNMTEKTARQPSWQSTNPSMHSGMLGKRGLIKIADLGDRIKDRFNEKAASNHRPFQRSLTLGLFLETRHVAIVTWVGFCSSCIVDSFPADG